MTQTTYRILPQSVILYGVEMTEPDKAPRVLLSCSTEFGSSHLDFGNKAPAASSQKNHTGNLNKCIIVRLKTKLD